MLFYSFTGHEFIFRGQISGKGFIDKMILLILKPAFKQKFTEH